MGRLKLHIPGPVEVSEKTYRAFCSPMIGHRSRDFRDLYAEIQPSLQKLFFTERLVFLSTSSAWGVMEGSLRNLVRKKALCCMGGGFSDKWFAVAKRCGKEASALKVDWGSPILPEQVDGKLASEEFDVLTVVHNETSTGVMNPLAEIMALKRKYPEVLFVVDSVSSFSAVPILFDEWGIDVLLTGSQKALALPPGLALFAVSAAALERAASGKDRGYYFDFLEFQKNAEKNMTPSTPSVGHVFALRSKLKEIFAEGLEERYERHRKLSEMTRRWAAKNEFTLFSEAGYESRTLTCVNNGAKAGGRLVDVERLRQKVKAQGILIDGGYGKIQGTTFRLSNMGDETESSMRALYEALDKGLAQL